MSTNKYERYSTKLKSTLEASLLGLLSKAIGKKINFQPEVQHLKWIDEDNDGIIFAFARVEDQVDIYSYQPSSYEDVTVERMLELLHAPALPSVQLNQSLKAVVLPTGHVLTYGLRLEPKELLNIGEKLVARGVPDDQGRYIALPISSVQEANLALALALKAGYSGHGQAYDDAGFVILDLAGREVWSRDEISPEYHQQVSAEEFINKASNLQEYYVTDISNGGYDVKVRPDGGVFHVGCQTVTAEKGLELYALIKAALAAYVPPAPPEPVLGNESTGHNPDGVDVSELAGGYRFIDKDEYVRGNNHRRLSELEMWEDGKWDKSGNRGNGSDRTYRTKLTREQLAAARRGETITQEDVKLVEELEAPVAVPAPLVELHNPGALEGGAYGADEGYRLLNVDEVRLNQTVPVLQEIERRNCSGNWVAGASGDSSGSTYRTRLTPQELAARRGLVNDPSVPAEVPVADPVF